MAGCGEPPRGGAERDGVELEVLEAAMVEAAKEEVTDEGRRRPGWFIAAQARLMPLITKRNEAMRAQSCARTPETKDRRRGRERR